MSAENNYRLSDLLDMSLIQKLADSNFRASGLPMSIVDAYDSSILVQAGWTDICLNFHRAFQLSSKRCIESDNVIKDHLAKKEFLQYKCTNGMWHVAIPILVAGRHMATMFLTQFYFEGEVPDRQYFIRQARELGYDLDAYLAALDKIRVFSAEKVNYMIAYDRALVRFICDLAEQSLSVIETQNSLHRSEEKYRDLYDNAPDMYHSINKDGIVIDCNETEAKMLGYRKEDIIGRPIVYFLTEESRKIYEQEFAVLKDHEAMYGLEREFIRKDGTTFMASLNVFIELDENGELLKTKTIGRDITESKKAAAELRRSREELRNLSAHIQSAREEERGHIAREIHDELGQILSKLKLDLSWLKKRLSHGQEQLIEKTEKMSGLVDTTITAVQRISSELRPGVLDHLGLSAAIEWQAKEFMEQTGITCSAVISNDLSVADQSISTAVFRIVQETLTNVIRHSKATSVHIDLTNKDNALVLEIRDDGKGIDNEKISSHSSFGLMGMRERARFLGGKINILGVPGKGTTVRLSIPLGYTASS